MNINELPDDCLMYLFRNNFPMQEWLTLRVICARWKSVIEAMCHSKGSLKLFVDIKDVYFYRSRLADHGLHDDEHLKLNPIGSDDDLILKLDIKINIIEQAMYRFLARLFNNIESLVVCGLNGPFFDLSYFARLWPNLRRVSFFGYLPANNPQYVYNIYRSLNSLASLERLGIFLDDETFVGQQNVPALLAPVFRQLKHFSTNNPLWLIAVTPKCRTIAVYPSHPTEPMPSLETVFGPNHPSAATLTSLKVRNVGPENLRFICTSFPSLEKLQIGFTREVGIPIWG